MNASVHTLRTGSTRRLPNIAEQALTKLLPLRGKASTWYNPLNEGSTEAALAYLEQSPAWHRAQAA